MTPRTLMELQKYLQNTFEDKVLLCTSCEEILTSVSLDKDPSDMFTQRINLLCIQGSACGKTECDVRVHRHCLFKWESSLKSIEPGLKSCSHCRKAWEPVPVGEAVLASQHSHVRQARGRRGADKDSDEEEQMTDEEEEQMTDEEDEVEDGDKEQEEEQEEQEEEQPRGGNRKRQSAAENTEPARRTRHKVEESDELGRSSSQASARPSTRRSSRR